MAQSKPTKIFPIEDHDDDLTMCGICNIEMEDARSLVCLHTYCLECLREWNKRSKNTHEVICPVCREPTSLQENGVDGLRRNFFVTKLKDRKAVSCQLMNKDVKITCTSCDITEDNEAVTRCLECDDFLCQDCHKAHKTLRLTKNHTAFTLKELKSGKFGKFKDNLCEDHPRLVVLFFCKSCDVPICRDCTVIKHPTASHEVISIDEAAASQRKEIQRLVILCKRKKGDIDEGLQQIEHMRCNIQSTWNAINSAIDDKKEKVKRSFLISLEKQTSKLKTRVSELMCAREKAASTYEDELQILNIRLTTALDMASRVTIDGSDCDVASVYKHLTTTLRQLRQTTTPDIDSGARSGDVRFIENVSLMTSVRSIGRLKVENAPWKMVRTFGDSGQDIVSHPRGVAINEDGNIAVTDKYESRVNVYDIDSGKLEMSIDTRQDLSFLSRATVTKSSPQDIVVYKGNYIVNDKTHNITVYNNLGKYVRQIRLKCDRNSHPTCIGINSIGHVVVGYNNAKLIHVYDYSDSKQIASFNIPFPAHYIAVSNRTDYTFVISNYWYGAYVVDSYGQTLHKLYPPHNVTAGIWRPKSVCTVGEGYKEEVFVCNTLCTSGVYRFSLGTGKYLGCVTTEVRDPHGIAITTKVRDRDGTAITVDGLIVADYHPACIKLFTEDD